MITGQWNPHKNPKDNRGIESVTDIIYDIADRALGGWDDFVDEISTYPQYILTYYMSEDCPEPLNDETYQKVMRENPDRVKRAIRMRICNRIY